MRTRRSGVEVIIGKAILDYTNHLVRKKGPGFLFGITDRERHCTPFVFYFKKIYFCTTKSYTAMVGYNRIPQSIPKNNKDILAKVADSKRKTSSPVPGTVKLPEKFSIAWK